MAQRSQDGTSLSRVGVHFHIEDGWHIYWRNPGEAGLSTLVELAIDGAMSAPDIRWPAPVRFSQPGGIVGFGYESEVVLEVELARQLSDEDADLQAFASWLACRERCVQGQARLHSSVDEAVQAGLAIDTWKDQLVPAPASQQALRVTSTPGATSGSQILWLSWPRPPGKVELFPVPPDELKVAPPEVHSRGLTSRAELELELIGERESWPSSFPAVVVAEPPNGSRVAYEISIPVR